jgi:small basic protein
MSVVAGLVGYLAAKPFKGKSNYFVCGAVTAAIIAVSLSFMFEQLGIVPSMFLALPYLFVVEEAVCVVGALIFSLIDTRFKWWKQ